MAVPTSGAGQERQNKKILEMLEEQKKRLRQQSATPGIMAATKEGMIPGMSGNTLPPNATSSDSQHMAAAQKAALQHAHANSVGYFITQDSAFGNLILPVLPRYDK